MKTLIVLTALVTGFPVNAAHFEHVLASVEGATGTEENFIPQVAWQDQPENAYYRCKERLPTPTLELWVGTESLVRASNTQDQPLLYGTNGPIQVLAYFNEDRKPFLAAYLILPSGETHLFRVNNEQRIVKSSKQWQCERQEWRAP